MSRDTEGDPWLWIRPHDKLGKPIDERLLAAAKRAWKRVRSYAELQGQDTATAADVLEDATQSLSSLFERHPQFCERIKCLEDYLFAVAAKRLNRLAAKEPPLEYVGSLDDLNPLQSVQDSNWALRLENDLALKEVKEFLNVRARYLFSLREMHYSWEDIAKYLGTTVNNVQSQFSQGVAKARRRILGRSPIKRNPTPDEGRAE